MRLICPNCDAQYEVADDVIPASGRDVQCSNCGQTWFQNRPDTVTQDSAPDDAADTPAPPRRELDPKVADILREEAALERKARAETAAPLESQPDLGLESGETHKKGQTAELEKDAAEPAPVTAPTAPASRRDLLPDIEEINSSLRSTRDQPTDQAPVHHATVRQESSGFQRGFSLMILLTVILIAVYAMAPQIAQSMPQADPYLSAYVAQVDTARSWLDGRVAAMLTWLDTIAGADQ